MFQTFNEHGVRFGRTVKNLQTAIRRVQAIKGEVRPLGSMSAVWSGKTLQPTFIHQPLIRATPPAPVRQLPQHLPWFRPWQPCYVGSRIRVSA